MDVTRRSHGTGRWISLALTLLLAALLAAPAVAQEEDSWPEGCTASSLPGADPEAQQQVLTCVPEHWNGALVAYVHGYESPQEPLELPEMEVGGRDVPEDLMDLGFAFATTSFSRNGFAVEVAGKDVSELVEHFKANAAPEPPEQVLLVGGSYGALVATMLLEREPERYHGAVAACGPLAGSAREIDYVGDFRVVFDHLFPEVFDFGALDEPPPVGEWEGYRMMVRDALAQRPDAAAELAAVSGVPYTEEFSEAALTLLAYNIGGFADLASIAGGTPYDNAEREYGGSSDDAVLNARVERVTADPEARQYMEEYYQPTGDLQRPLAVLHTRDDPIVPFEHAETYAARVEAAGAGAQLSLMAPDRYGHCNLEADEVLGAVAWVVDRTDVSVEEALRSRLEAEFEQLVD